MQKRVRVVFANDELENEFNNLSDNDILKKRINRVIERLKEKPNFGQPIAKKLIPNRYRELGFNNAFWVDLGKEERLIYSLISENKEDIIATIIEWFIRHKDYERRFRY
ncbi:hypothetical protein J4221_03525 [Candidatus Pacearchaeota archaeon]|nr:hypothetical protein [Candidatus Pacearchaeota archaeon]